MKSLDIANEKSVVPPSYGAVLTEAAVVRSRFLVKLTGNLRQIVRRRPTKIWSKLDPTWMHSTTRTGDFVCCRAARHAWLFKFASLNRTADGCTVGCGHETEAPIHTNRAGISAQANTTATCSNLLSNDMSSPWFPACRASSISSKATRKIWKSSKATSP